MVMKVEHAGDPTGYSMETETDGGTDREREVELPVGVGIGVVHLFLLEELRDCQQLFQHMLRTHRGREYRIHLTSYSIGFYALTMNDNALSYTPAVLLSRCSRCGVHLSE